MSSGFSFEQEAGGDEGRDDPTEDREHEPDGGEAEAEWESRNDLQHGSAEGFQINTRRCPEDGNF